VVAGRKWVRFLGLTAFAAVFALAGGLWAKKWKTEGKRANSSASVATPPLAGPPAPPSSSEAKRPAPTKMLAAAVVPAPAATAPLRVRHAKRARIETPTPPPAPVSRLHTWDPDSPKPP
jgi:hypothetical protein